MVLRQIIIAFLLTSAIFSLTVLFENNTSSVDWYLFTLLITAISFGLPNALLLLLTYWLNIGQDVLLKTKYLFIEVVLLFSIFLLVNKAVMLIPVKYRYYSIPTISGQKFAFQAGPIIFYSFIILFIVLLTRDRIKKNRTK
jgi:hypothetical protein